MRRPKIQTDFVPRIPASAWVIDNTRLAGTNVGLRHSARLRNKSGAIQRGLSFREQFDHCPAFPRARVGKVSREISVGQQTRIFWALTLTKPSPCPETKSNVAANGSKSMSRSLELSERLHRSKSDSGNPWRSGEGLFFSCPKQSPAGSFALFFNQPVPIPHQAPNLNTEVVVKRWRGDRWK